MTHSKPALLLPLLTALAASGLAEESRAKPNILFCIADDASYPHMGAYGCSWVRTPAFDRVAREGILFTNAYTPNAKCAPSRASILTGRNSWQLEAACNHVPYFPPRFKTYAEALRESGYFVGKTAKGWAPGIALDEDGKPRELAGRPFERRKATPPARGISNNDYSGNFRDFLDARPAGAPFCFWYGAIEPHRAYEYGAGVKKGGKSLADVDRVPRHWPDNEVVRNDLLDYAFEIEHFDTHLARMIALLEERGELDNTLVVVTADNGMPFPRIKGQEYEASNHLPLAAMWKGGIRKPGRVVDDYVSFVDLAPTFVEIAGLKWEETGMQPSPGRSLTDILFSERSGRVTPERDHVLIGKERHDIGRPNDWGYPIRGVVRDGLLYLRNFETARWPAGNPETGYLNTDGSPTKTEVLRLRRDGGPAHYWRLCFGKRVEEELFDLQKDPDCLINLADDPAFAPRKEQLRSFLSSRLKSQGDPRMDGRGGLFEAYPYAQERMRDYYGKYMSGEKLPAGWVNESDYESPPVENGPPGLDLYGVPGVVIDHQPASSGLYVGSPSIAVLPDGSYVASHDLFGPKSNEHERATTRVFGSTDRGRSWSPRGEIQGQFWSKLFVHDGALYIFGTWKHHGNLIVRRSSDGGRTWTEPSDAATGLLAEGQYHTAPVPFLVHEGRLWRAVEDATGGTKWGERYQALVLSMPLDADPLSRESWTFTQVLPRDPTWLNGDFGGWLEGNVVAAPDGGVVNILRVETPPPVEKAAIVRVTRGGTRLEFDPTTGFVDFPGGAKKFAIRRDPTSEVYWSLTNLIPPPLRDQRPGRVRNTVALIRSPDLRTWEARSIILHHPDVARHGFQYLDWLFDGEDLIVASRTAYDDGLGGARNNHDANLLTFHRVERFRGLTLADSVVDPGSLGLVRDTAAESRE